MGISRRSAIMGLGLGSISAATTVLSKPALASGVTHWNMVTSWPRNLPGPGVTAQILADTIDTLSDGRLKIRLHGAGELIPALQVFSAVADGTAHMAHTAPLFWAGKFPASPIFTAAPFGLTPLEHISWITKGGGQALWNELYQPHGVKPFMAGNTGYQMGGWYKKPIISVADFKGLKIRMPGLGGLVVQKLGAVPVGLPPSQIFISLQSGVIDATEFLGPFSDAAMGFHKIAKNYYFPGFHEPNGTAEALVSKKALEALPDDLQQIVAKACEWENMRALADSEWENARALKILQNEHAVVLRKYPDDVLKAARIAASEVMMELAASDEISGRIVDSYLDAAKHLGTWSDVSVKSFLDIRE